MKKQFLLSILIFLIPLSTFAQTVGNEKDKTAVSNSNSNPNLIQPVYDPTLSSATAGTTSNASSGNTSSSSEVYIVLEAGTILNKSLTSGSWANFETQNNSGGSFGAALGYRAITSSNWLYGLELSIASSSASSSVTDNSNVRIFDAKHISGLYGALGHALGTNRQSKIYVLLGIGATKANSVTQDLNGTTEGTLSENGNGFSMGAAFEYQISEDFGLRFKALHNFYRKGEIEELRIRDTSFMGGLVITF